MRASKMLNFFPLLLLGLLPFIATAQPTNLYWDIDGSVEGAGSANPVGTWDSVTANWNASPDGTAEATTWVDGNIAVFAAGTNSTGAYSVTVGSLITADAIQFEEGTVNLSGAEIDLTGSGGVDVAAGLSATIGSATGGSAGLTKSGAGLLTLDGVNIYSGATTVSAGKITLGAAGVIPDSSAVSVVSGASFDLNNFSETIGSLAGGGSVLLGNGTLTTGGAGSSTTFSGVISGTGGKLTKTGGGILTLSGNNTYTGTTTIAAGTLQLGVANRISDSSAVSVSSGAIFNLNNFNETVGSLADAGTVTLGIGTLSAGGNNTSTTYSGNITGSGGLTKKGTGKMTLTGTGSSYAGSTRIEAGTLSINATTPLGSNSSLLDLAGGTLDISTSRSITNPVSLTASSQLSSVVASGVLRTLDFLSGTFNNTGGTLTIRNTGTGGRFSVRLRSGGLNITRPIVIGQVGDANNAATNAILRCDHQSGGDQIISGNISGPGIFERNANASIGGFRTILTGNNSYSGRTDLRGGFIGIGSPTALGTAPIIIGQDPQLLGFFASGAARVVTNRMTFEPTTTAATNLILSGSLPLTFTGPITLHPGNICRLIVSNGMVATFSGVISGTMGLEKADASTLILAGANLYGGVTLVNGGTLLVNNTSGSGTGTSAVTVNSGTTLGGTGRISGLATLNSGSKISPGTTTANSGIMTFQNGLNLSGGATYVWELNANSASSPGVNFDQIAMTGGNLALGGTSKLTLNFAGSATVPNLTNTFWRSPHSWTIVAGSGTASNTALTRFSSVTSSQYPTLQYFTNSVDAKGNVILTYDPTSPFYGLYDAGPGFFSGENVILTNAAGLGLSVWSSARGGQSITNWNLEGATVERR